jgi:putative transposase
MIVLRSGYKTDRDVAAGQNIRNRGIAKRAFRGKLPPETSRLISTVGQTGMETAYADDLPGIGETQSRQVSKSRKRVTRKSKK